MPGGVVDSLKTNKPPDRMTGGLVAAGGGVVAPQLLAPDELLKSSVAVKRRSLGFWTRSRLPDVLRIAHDRRFRPGEKLTAVDLARDARQAAACGHSLRLHYPALNVSTGEVAKPYINRGYFCQMPAVCPVCSRRVGDVRQARYSPVIEECLRKGLHPYLVTFTVDADGDLRAQTARLRRSLRRFQVNFRLPSDPEKKARALARGRKAGEWQKVAACGLKIEVKRGEGSGLWHVHAHALVFTTAPLDYKVFATAADKAAGRPARTIFFRGREVGVSKISGEWHAATGGRAMGIDVHPLYKDRKTGKRMSTAGMVAAAREVMKYTTLLDDASTSDDWVEIRAGMWGRRLWSVYGDFRGVPDADDYEEEDEDAQLVQEFDVSWRGGYTGQYEQVRAPRLVDLKGRREYSLKCLTIRARINGAARKMRTAILRAREVYMDTGYLPDRFEVDVAIATTGERRIQDWPRPPYLTPLNASSGEGWERWVNEVSAAARAMMASVESDARDMDVDDVLGFRFASDAMVSDETWHAWGLVLDLKREYQERRRAFATIQAGGGIQQDAFAPDYFDAGRVEGFCERHSYDHLKNSGFFDPVWDDPWRCYADPNRIW